MEIFGKISVEADQSEAALIVRADEIKNLFENKHPAALKNIERQQEKQKINQNKVHNITDETLEIGSTVLIKNDGIIGKLEPRYKGPYQVIRLTSHKNYVLKNALGDEEKNAYPLHKLKKVDRDMKFDETEEIEKILDHRVVNGKTTYLVKWKGQPKSQNSWLPVENFDNLGSINKYWKSFKETPNSFHKMKTRSKQLNAALTILVFFAVICFGLGLEVNSSFPYCSESFNTQPIDIENTCKILSVSKPNAGLWLTTEGGKPYTEIVALVYEKVDYMVSGEGFQCKKVWTETTYTTSFWGSQYKSTISKSMKLNAGDCWAMVTTKRCGDNEMKCVVLVCMCFLKAFQQKNLTGGRSTKSIASHAFHSHAK